jgi:thymidine phosphorylase
MLSLAGVGDDVDPAAALRDGRALAVWNDLIAAQGGDPSAPLPVASERSSVRAERAGYVQRLDARAVGVAAWRLGAGRARKEDPVSATAGVVCLAKEGDVVDAGQPVLELHADDASRFETALDALRGGILIGDDAPPARPLVLDRITAD